MGKFSLAKPEGVCAVDGKPIGEGDEFYAVVFEDGEGLRREDYCLDCWDETPEGALRSFKTKLPEKTAPKRLLVDDQILVQFFERLDDATEPARLNFRFVLALILMRKRLLRYESTDRQADGEWKPGTVAYFLTARRRLGGFWACHALPESCYPAGGMAHAWVARFFIHPKEHAHDKRGQGT